MLDIPQSEQLPSEAELLTAQEQDDYLEQLEPYLAFHGFKSTNWGEWLELNAVDVEDSLVFMQKNDDPENHKLEREWRIHEKSFVCKPFTRSERCD